MKKYCLLAVLTLLAAPAATIAADLPQLPPPEKEHAWLQQLAGDWTTEVELTMEPGKPPMKAKGHENSRMLGGFWLVADGGGDMMGMPYKSVLTLGFDPAKKKYVGSWVDSMSSYQWHYEGTVDATGKILTLETKGPCPLAPGKLINFKEVTEIKSKDHKVFTSSFQGDDGKWTTAVKIDFRRAAAHGKH